MVVLASSDGRQIVSRRHDTSEYYETRENICGFLRDRDMLMLNIPTSSECAVFSEYGMMVGNVAIRKTYP